MCADYSLLALLSFPFVFSESDMPNFTFTKIPKEYEEARKHVEHSAPPIFKDYLKKFSPLTAWERIKKAKNKTDWKHVTEDEVEELLSTIDPIEELLKFKIDDVEVTNPELFLNNSRRWQPPGRIVRPGKERDAYTLKPRLYDLMKQSIYQARDKMIDMITLREQYRNDSLYKMGVLISKTDTTAKLLSQVAYRAWRHCELLRRVGSYATFRMIPMYETMEAEERVLNLWLEVELLVDFMNVMDKRCKERVEKFHMLPVGRLQIRKRDWFKEKY